MEPGAEQPQSIHFEIQVPDDVEVGVYANFLSVWNGPHDFTFDFAVTGQGVTDEDQLTIPTRVVARVKVPLTVAEDILRAIAEQVSNLEDSVGRIRKPGETSTSDRRDDQ